MKIDESISYAYEDPCHVRHGAETRAKGEVDASLIFPQEHQIRFLQRYDDTFIIR